MPDISVPRYYSMKPADFTPEVLGEFYFHLVCEGKTNNYIMKESEHPGMSDVRNTEFDSGGLRKSVFTQSRYKGVPGSPERWLHEVNSRMDMADGCTKDLGILSELQSAGVLDRMEPSYPDGVEPVSKDQALAFTANRMARIRYGFEAGSNPARALDYKQATLTSLRCGGVGIIKSDIQAWKDDTGKLLARERERAFRPEAVPVLTVYMDDPSIGMLRKSDMGERTRQEYTEANAVAFYDLETFRAYAEQLLHDRASMRGRGIEISGPDKAFKTRTADPNDWDMKYRIRQITELAQGKRIMTKNDWIMNAKAQVAYNKIGGRMQALPDLAGKNDMLPAHWFDEVCARRERGEDLIMSLEDLSHVSDPGKASKFLPMYQTCVKFGWAEPVPKPTPEQPKPRKTPEKERLFRLRRDTFFLAMDAAYGPDVANAVREHWNDNGGILGRFPQGSAENPGPRELWGHIKAGKFDVVNDFIADRAGRVLDVQDELSEFDGTEPAIASCSKGSNLTPEQEPDMKFRSFGALKLYTEDVCLRCKLGIDKLDDFRFELSGLTPEQNHELYQIQAAVYGHQPLDFKSWQASLQSGVNASMPFCTDSMFREDIKIPVAPRETRRVPGYSVPAVPEHILAATAAVNAQAAQAEVEAVQDGFGVQAPMDNPGEGFDIGVSDDGSAVDQPIEDMGPPPPDAFSVSGVEYPAPPPPGSGFVPVMQQPTPQFNRVPVPVPSPAVPRFNPAPFPGPVPSGYNPNPVPLQPQGVPVGLAGGGPVPAPGGAYPVPSPPVPGRRDMRQFYQQAEGIENSGPADQQNGSQGISGR